MKNFDMWGEINKIIKADNEKEAIKIFTERYKNIPIEIEGKKVIIKCGVCDSIIFNNEDYGYNSGGDFICEKCFKEL